MVQFDKSQNGHRSGKTDGILHRRFSCHRLVKKKVGQKANRDSTEQCVECAARIHIDFETHPNTYMTLNTVGHVNRLDKTRRAMFEGCGEHLSSSP